MSYLWFVTENKDQNNSETTAMKKPSGFLARMKDMLHKSKTWTIHLQMSRFEHLFCLQLNLDHLGAKHDHMNAVTFSFNFTLNFKVDKENTYCDL